MKALRYLAIDYYSDGLAPPEEYIQAVKATLPSHSSTSRSSPGQDFWKADGRLPHARSSSTKAANSRTSSKPRSLQHRGDARISDMAHIDTGDDKKRTSS